MKALANKPLHVGIDRCSEIEKANRHLLEKMTCILAGQGQNFPQHQKGYMPPIPAYQVKPPRQEKAQVTSLRSRRTKGAVTKSLNGNARTQETQRITNENEALLKRLQEQSSVYNVYDWEHDRKKQIKIVKSICYHNPGGNLIGKNRRKSTRRGTGFESAKNEPNRQLFELYQTSLRGSIDPATGLDVYSSMAGPMSGEESAHKKNLDNMGPGHIAIGSAGMSTDMGSTTLPEV